MHKFYEGFVYVRGGVYMVPGKVLNVRIATEKAISENKVINNLITIIGLKKGNVYDVSSELEF